MPVVAEFDLTSGRQWNWNCLDGSSTARGNRNRNCRSGSSVAPYLEYPAGLERIRYRAEKKIEKARMPVRASQSWIRQFHGTLGVCRMQDQLGRSPTRNKVLRTNLSPERSTTSTDSPCLAPVCAKPASVTMLSNPTPVRSKCTSQPFPTSVPSSLSIASTPTAVKETASPMPLNTSCIDVWSVTHLFRSLRPKLSSPERIFLLLAKDLGLDRASFQAAISGWQVQRPLRALLAMTNESGKNYSVRSAKRKRLSGSLAVSKKHSSGG